jgi:hypothetical protein
MKVKRLVSLLEGLCKMDPEANVSFRISPYKEDKLAKAHLGGYDTLTNLDIEAVYNAFGCPGGEEPENPEDSFMDIIIELDYADEIEKRKLEILEEGEKEFNRIYKTRR